jgi:hypothetical protein
VVIAVVGWKGGRRGRLPHGANPKAVPLKVPSSDLYHLEVQWVVLSLR